MTSSLTHFDDEGASRMVDVGSKETTLRVAVAIARVSMEAETLQLITDRKMSKGNVLEVARLAGIMATKKTSDLIPLCHALGLDKAEIEFEILDQNTIEIKSTAANHGKTGVEMEALTGATICALTIYDMCKAVDRAMVIGPVYLAEKSGGKSGHFLRSAPPV